MAISKTPAPPSRSSLLRRIRALETRLEELGGPAAEPDPGEGHQARAAQPDPASEIQELVACGRPLTAARRYRELTGCDEAEARRAVDILSGGTGDDA